MQHRDPQSYYMQPKGPQPILCFQSNNVKSAVIRKGTKSKSLIDFGVNKDLVTHLPTDRISQGCLKTMAWSSCTRNTSLASGGGDQKWGDRVRAVVCAFLLWPLWHAMPPVSRAL